MAQYFEKNQLSTQNLFMPKDYEIWSFDFYTNKTHPRKEVSLLKKGIEFWYTKMIYKILHNRIKFFIRKRILKSLNFPKISES